MRYSSSGTYIPKPTGQTLVFGSWAEVEAFNQRCNKAMEEIMETEYLQRCAERWHRWVKIQARAKGYDLSKDGGRRDFFQSEAEIELFLASDPEKNVIEAD